MTDGRRKRKRLGRQKRDEALRVLADEFVGAAGGLPTGRKGEITRTNFSKIII